MSTGEEIPKEPKYVTIKHMGLWIFSEEPKSEKNKKQETGNKKKRKKEKWGGNLD